MFKIFYAWYTSSLNSSKCVIKLGFLVKGCKIYLSLLSISKIVRIVWLQIFSFEARACLTINSLSKQSLIWIFLDRDMLLAKVCLTYLSLSLESIICISSDTLGFKAIFLWISGFLFVARIFHL